MQIARQHMFPGNNDLADLAAAQDHRGECCAIERWDGCTPLLANDPQVDRGDWCTCQQSAAALHDRKVLLGDSGKWNLGDWFSFGRSVDCRNFRTRKNGLRFT